MQIHNPLQDIVIRSENNGIINMFLRQRNSLVLTKGDFARCQLFSSRPSKHQCLGVIFKSKLGT